jgi:glycerol-3-phosphate dehydrogenase (NAD(P)+)
VARRAGNEVALWARDEAVVEAINAGKGNPRYLPGIALDSGLCATTDVMVALDGAHTLLLVIPAQAMAEFCEALSEIIRPQTTVICCAKGIDRETGLLPAEIAGDALPGCPVAALSGPSFAADVARGLPTAVTLAASTLEEARRLSALLSSKTFRCYSASDLVGVELGGALKNVMAIAIGVVRGLGLGASAEAALFARAFDELRRLAVALGAQPTTLTGLSGLGDLVLTCSGPQSRNFAYGMRLGEGKTTAGMPLAEGAFTAEIANRLALENGVEAPVISTVADLIDGRLAPQLALGRLMERPLKSEFRE